MTQTCFVDMNIEEEVKFVYNKIAKKFDNTRYRTWTCVETFLNTLPKNSLIGDIGCGNGKNMLFRTDCEYIGCDFSEEMVKICKEKSLNVFNADVCALPFKDDVFDAIICIAVIHHLSTSEKREMAIRECKRVLKNKGKMLILVWAFEQESNSKRKFQTQDEFVAWKDKKQNIIGLRYYHLFCEHELASYFEKSVSIFYEKGNWGIVYEK